ncbi:MAG: hypothetical protein ACXAB7_02040 [Candidatus Kariarchaeaceae archaeon]
MTQEIPPLLHDQLRFPHRGILSQNYLFYSMIFDLINISGLSSGGNLLANSAWKLIAALVATAVARYGGPVLKAAGARRFKSVAD